MIGDPVRTQRGETRRGNRLGRPVPCLECKSLAERAKALIGLAHPEFREGLEREAREKNVIPKGFS